jgi:DNA invertase Pin-like site-specific DNA recombinase
MMTIQNRDREQQIIFPGKIQSHHRERTAIVYIRQSTLQQVERNKESTKLQYALKDKACAIGWAKEKVIIIDEDLGRSGANAEGRPGFQKLVTEVSLNHVGIILGIEISRLARSCRDWHQLLEVCSLFQTLIADTDGIYDPSNYNDRLLLGLKGTMSEAELHVIKQRMLAGKKAKARRGELGLQLAMGYIRHPSGEIIKDPDEQAQSTIFLIFKLFDKYRTINAVLKHLVKNNIQMPHRERSGLTKGDLIWRRPNRVTLGNLFHNPIYAGAYVYGRRPTDPRKKKPGRPSTGRTVTKQSDWEVLIKDKVPSYITWAEYERNERQLLMNSSKGVGVAKHGTALVAGLVICGRCGLRMSASYSDNGSKLRYSCSRESIDYGGDLCQSLIGKSLDKIIEKSILETMQPCALEISLKAAEDLEQNRKQNLNYWQQRLERTQYETQRAYRQYNSVEPENRLVVRTLEKKWEEALSAETKLKQDYDSYLTIQPTILSTKEREQIRKLASDIPMLWNSSTTTQAQRKNIIRILIERVIVTIKDNTEKVQVEIHWAGGHKTSKIFDRPVAKIEQLSYYQELLQRVATLYNESNHHEEIANILNTEGWCTAKQRSGFTANTVRTLLRRKKITGKKKTQSKIVERENNELTINELSNKLNIPEPTLYKWIRLGKLIARKDTSTSGQGIWLVHADSIEINKILEFRNRPKQWIYNSKVDKVD